MVEIARHGGEEEKISPSKVFRSGELRRMGHGRVLGVGQGSTHPPR